MDGLIFVIFFMIFIYPAMIFLLIATDLLVYLNNPIWRFGVIILITFVSIFFLRRKKYSKRKNDFLEDFSLQSGKVNNIEYFYKFIYNEKHKSSLIAPYVEGIYGYDFQIKLEGKRENFFKKIGLNKECQTGNSKFDNELYIFSDDTIVCKQLKENDKLRMLILEIFYKFNDQGINVIGIVCFDGRITISAESKSEQSNESEASYFARESAILLKEIIDILMSTDNSDERIYRDKSSLIILVTILISFGLIVNGFIGIIVQKTTVGIIPRLVEAESLMPLALQLATLFSMIGTIIIFMLLRNSSQRSTGILTVFSIGFFGFFLSSLVEIKDVNMYFDTSTPEIKNYLIVDKEAQWYPKHRTVYKLNLISQSKPQDFYYGEVTYDIYSKAEKDKNVLIYFRKGFLNYQWIEKIEILDESPFSRK